MRFVTDNLVVDKTANKDGLKVICAGLPRCATSSLQHVMDNEFAFAPCMHMAHVFPSTAMLKLVLAALEENDKAKRQELLHQVFDGFAAAADYPTIMFIEDLVEMYPDAKLILNKRESPEVWLKSITGTLRFFGTMPYHVMTYLLPTDYWHYQGHQAAYRQIDRRLGIKNIFSVEAYNIHNDDVRRIAKEHGKELFQWEPADGWEPLCNFLGKPVPDKPFPRLNDTTAIRILASFLTIRGLFAWAAAFLTPVLGWYAIYRAISRAR